MEPIANIQEGFVRNRSISFYEKHWHLDQVREEAHACGIYRPYLDYLIRTECTTPIDYWAMCLFNPTMANAAGSHITDVEDLKEIIPVAVVMRHWTIIANALESGLDEDVTKACLRYGVEDVARRLQIHTDWRSLRRSNCVNIAEKVLKERMRRGRRERNPSAYPAVAEMLRRYNITPRVCVPIDYNYKTLCNANNANVELAEALINNDMEKIVELMYDVEEVHVAIMFKYAAPGALYVTHARSMYWLMNGYLDAKIAGGDTAKYVELAKFVLDNPLNE